MAFASAHANLCCLIGRYPVREILLSRLSAETPAVATSMEHKYPTDPHNSRVYDEIIEVFLVDNPTPTDWIRLLAFSKEWIHILPHFYRRFQKRADNESDLGMKHKLLRLVRKLKEVMSLDSVPIIMNLVYSVEDNLF
ncbi:hypothetical protein NE237_017787 [Protea cynaroides]|uniref:Uncharacterized protein n=1 Tax=Protea cynaroides TaxID=273540 RepID=A0A9Q0QNE3_9MAGN|nr:hypothetical protein NE237_017787 [Protea cynaroides]